MSRPQDDFRTLAQVVEETFGEGSLLRQTAMSIVNRLEAEAPQEERTYRCPECLDVGYQIHHGVRRGRPSTVAGPCLCDRGQKIRAGQWFDLCYPGESGKRAADAKQLDRLKAACLEDRERGPALWENVERLRREYESRRSRKLAEVDRA